MYQMMNGLGFGWNGASFIFWITTILSWTILVLIIISLIKWINKK